MNFSTPLKIELGDKIISDVDTSDNLIQIERVTLPNRGCFAARRDRPDKETRRLGEYEQPRKKFGRLDTPRRRVLRRGPVGSIRGDPVKRYYWQDHLRSALGRDRLRVARALFCGQEEVTCIDILPASCRAPV